MAEVTIEENTWRDLVAVARRRRQNPGRLADEALREYLQRQDDEELLTKSARVAQSTSFNVRETEVIIRRHRQRKKKA